MRHPPRSNRPLLLASLAVIALLAFLLSGCGSHNGAGTPWANSVTGIGDTNRNLSPRNPAYLAVVMGVQDKHTPDLMAIPGVVGTGTGADINGHAAVLVLTREPGVRGIPSSVEGVPVDVRVVGDVRAYATIQCGTSTGNDLECSAGTIGCVVMKGTTPYFLSNNHVFARENAAAIGERIDAPGRYDGKPKCARTPQLGTLAAFQKINFGGTNTIDCAIAAPSAGVSYTCAEAGGYTPSTTTVAASVGLAVKKTGRTSRLTHGTIQAINVTVNVGYLSGTATFTGQIMTSGKFIKSGDSGSLMVTETGNNPVGLCFAGGSGGSFENPIGPVLQAFGATVCGQ